MCRFKFFQGHSDSFDHLAHRVDIKPSGISPPTNYISRDNGEEVLITFGGNRVAIHDNDLRDFFLDGHVVAENCDVATSCAHLFPSHLAMHYSASGLRLPRFRGHTAQTSILVHLD